MILGNKVLTGSTNFTTTGVTKNLNHVIVVDDAEVANAYKKEFREIQRENFGRYSIGADEKPKDARVSGIRVKPLFAPDHSPEMEIMKQILKAKKRMDFAAFTFAKSSGIDEALIAAKKPVSRSGAFWIENKRTRSGQQKADGRGGGGYRSCGRYRRARQGASQTHDN